MSKSAKDRRVVQRRQGDERRLVRDRRLGDRREVPLVLEVGQRAGEDRRNRDRRRLDRRGENPDRRGVA